VQKVNALNPSIKVFSRIKGNTIYFLLTIYFKKTEILSIDTNLFKVFQHFPLIWNR